MKFIFSTELPAKNQGYYFNFSNQDFKNPDWTYIDAKHFILKFQKELFEDIEKWHSAIGVLASRKVSYWWMTPASRLLSWSPPVYQSLLFSVAICELIKKENSNVFYILNASDQVIRYLQEFQPTAYFEFQGATMTIKPVSSFAKEYIRPGLGIIRNHLNGIMNNSPTPINSNCEYLIFSQILNINNILNLTDHFYGNIFFQKEDNNSNKMHWFYYYPENISSIKNKIRNVFSQKNISVSFTHDYLNFLDIFKIIFKSLKHKVQMASLKQNLSAIKISNYTSKYFIDEYNIKVLTCRQNIVAELEILFALEKINQKNIFKKVLYPYEEKSLERAILKSSNSKSIISLGFVHAALNDGHICFNLSSNTLANPPRPKEILVTGEAPRDYFIAKGYDQENIKIIGSPRALNKFEGTKIFHTDKLRILVIVGQDHELNALAALVEKNPESIAKYQFTIRKHPHGSLIEQEKGYKRLAKLIPDIKDEGGSLREQVEKNDIVIFSTSSGGIESIFLGAIGVYVCMDDFFTLNPLASLKDKLTIPQIFSIKELGSFLKKIEKLDQESIKKIQKEQIGFASKIYQTPNIDILFKK